MTQSIDFLNRDFLTAHIAKTMSFYQPNDFDEKGGFNHYFRDDGSIYNQESRHLVSSTRFIFNYAMASIATSEPSYLDRAKHGIQFLRQHHRNPNTGGYAWVLENRKAVDQQNHCYGLAFVLLAYSCGLKAGIEECHAYIDETFSLMERYFWQEHYQLYADECSADWQVTSPYRGQNANMHSCEAMIAAYEATQDERFLDRAFTLADNICNRQANLAQQQIWEHYDSNWNVDWDYNRDDAKNLFRPWGFQPGHFTEWAKLLLILDRHRATPWLFPRAKQLFDQALATAWDNEYGGICYGFAPDGTICDDDKYFWVQAESFAAAALLIERSETHSEREHYRQCYQKIWQYSWQHMIDHQYGAWYRILQRDNRAYDNLKSPAGKTDYHTMGACYEVIAMLDRCQDS